MFSFITSPLRLHNPVRKRATATCSLKPEKGSGGDDESNNDLPWAVLRRRLTEVRDKEISRDRTLAQNWREGKYQANVAAWATNAYVRKLSLDGDFLAFGTSTGSVIFSDLISGLSLTCANVHTGQVTAIDYNDSYMASAGSADHTVALWDCSRYEKRSFWAKKIEKGTDIEGILSDPTFKCEPHTDIVSAVKVDKEGRRLYSASIDGEVRIVNLDNGETLHVIHVGEPVLSMTLTEKRYLLLGCASGRVQAYESERGIHLLSMICHGANTTAVDFWEESQMLATGDSSGNMSVWSFKDCKLLGSLPRHDAAVMSIQLDGSKVVSASRDGSVAVTTIDSFDRQYSISGFTKYLACAVFDETRLIADGTNDVIVCHYFDGEDGIA